MGGIQGSTKTVTATIPNGTALSQVINLAGQVLVGIQTPAAWTAADLSFQVSQDGVTFAPMYDEFGVAVVVKCDVSRHIRLQASDLLSARYLKIQSGVVGSAVNQGAARTLMLVTRSVQ